MKKSEKIVGKSTSYWKDAWRRFRKNKLAVFGVIVIILLAIMAFIGEPISGESYDKTNLMNVNKSPSADHWFGTDNLGRDVFARTWYGAKISLFIGLMASLIDLVIGVIWGAVAGFFGGKVDEYMMRIADILSWCTVFIGRYIINGHYAKGAVDHDHCDDHNRMD